MLPDNNGVKLWDLTGAPRSALLFEVLHGTLSFSTAKCPGGCWRSVITTSSPALPDGGHRRVCLSQGCRLCRNTTFFIFFLFVKRKSSSPHLSTSYGVGVSGFFAAAASSHYFSFLDSSPRGPAGFSGCDGQVHSPKDPRREKKEGNSAENRDTESALVRPLSTALEINGRQELRGS